MESKVCYGYVNLTWPSTDLWLSLIFRLSTTALSKTTEKSLSKFLPVFLYPSVFLPCNVYSAVETKRKNGLPGEYLRWFHGQRRARAGIASSAALLKLFNDSYIAHFYALRLHICLTTPNDYFPTASARWRLQHFIWRPRARRRIPRRRKAVLKPVSCIIMNMFLFPRTIRIRFRLSVRKKRNGCSHWFRELSQA